MNFTLLNNFGFDLLHNSPKNVPLNLSPASLLKTVGLLSAFENNEKVLHWTNEENKLAASQKNNAINNLIEKVLKADLEFFIPTVSAGVCYDDSNEFKAANKEIEQFKGAKGVSSANEQISKSLQNRLKNVIHSDGKKTLFYNTFYLKSEYCNIFMPDCTEEKTFHVDSKTSVKIPFMNYGGMVMFNEDKDIGVRMMSHNFNGCNYQIIVMVPTVKFGLEEMERKLTGEKFSKLVCNMRSVLGGIWLPRLTLEGSCDVGSSLEKMGLSRNLHGSWKQPCHLDGVIHAVSMSFNEFGCHIPPRTPSEQEMIPVCCGGFMEPPEEQDVTADQPFLLAVVMNKDDKCGLISLSRVMKP